MTRLVRKNVAWFAAVTAAATLPVVRAADTTTNDILGLADFASSGFNKGFSIGLPILILVVMLGWLLFGLRTGLKGKK